MRKIVMRMNWKNLFSESKRWTALHAAADMGSLESLYALLDGGANINSQDNANRSPLYFACAKVQTCNWNLTFFRAVFLLPGNC